MHCLFFWHHSPLKLSLSENMTHYCITLIQCKVNITLIYTKNAILYHPSITDLVFEYEDIKFLVQSIDHVHTMSY